jgi:hypothetical protein
VLPGRNGPGWAEVGIGRGWGFFKRRAPAAVPCPAREPRNPRQPGIRLSALAASKSIGTLKNRGQGVAASTVKVDVIIEMLQSALKVRVVL